MTLHVLYVENAPAGYYELRRHEDGSVEIAYFGLLARVYRPRARRLDAHARSQDAWQPRREPRLAAHLHARSPIRAAELPKRGFVPYKTETYDTEA